jgi:flagellar basal-body rod protein FlgF
MIYGMYLSATGVLTNTYRQDVIANNLANSESVGFKKDLALFRERKTAAEEMGGHTGQVDSNLENIGGGLLANPTLVDTSQGEIEPTGNNMDLAISGKGYFAVQSGGKVSLTRNGQFMVNRNGDLVLGNNGGQTVLDTKQAPIQLLPNKQVTFSTDGTVMQGGNAVAKIGLFDVSDPSQLKKEGGTLLTVPPSQSLATDSNSMMKSGFVERSNVDPATELASLMDTQRQLEANANMIRYQDQTLGELISSVGKVS